jgi:hypothetical protein
VSEDRDCENDVNKSQWRVFTPPGSLPRIVSDDQIIADRVYNGHGPLIASAPMLREVLMRIHDLAYREGGVSPANSEDALAEIWSIAHAALMER